MNWVLLMTLYLRLVFVSQHFLSLCFQCVCVWISEMCLGGSVLFYYEGSRSVLFYCLVFSILELECLFCLHVICNVSLCDFISVSCCWLCCCALPPMRVFYVEQIVLWYSIPSTALFSLFWFLQRFQFTSLFIVYLDLVLLATNVM